jgi:hypothetical protein
MSGSASLDPKSVGRRGVLLLTALAVSIGMFFAIAAGPVTKAHAGAEYFCYSYVVAQGNCFSSGAHPLTWVRGYGYNHSACSNAYLNGFVTNWACAPTGTWSNSYFDGSRNMVGVVRNNAPGSPGQIWGYQEYL